MFFVNIRIHRHIEDVYKRAKLNSDGTLSVKVHNRKMRVTRIIGYRLPRGRKKIDFYVVCGR